MSLQEIRFCREQTGGEEIRFALEDLDSHMWEEYSGACGNVSTAMKALMKEEAGEGRTERLEELCGNLNHQMTFYKAIYLSVPYITALLEKALEEEEFEWQLELVSQLGIVLSTDIPCNHEDAVIEGEILSNYGAAVRKVVYLTQQFLDSHIKEIRQLDDDSRSWLATAVLSILGDREAAFLLTISGWDSGEMDCERCGYYDEETILSDEEAREAVSPAESVIGEWDGTSYEDTYLWFSNFLGLIGAEKELELLPYFYGTYTCPECGKEGIVIEMMKRFYEEECG